MSVRHIWPFLIDCAWRMQSWSTTLSCHSAQRAGRGRGLALTRYFPRNSLQRSRLVLERGVPSSWLSAVRMASAMPRILGVEPATDRRGPLDTVAVRLSPPPSPRTVTRRARRGRRPHRSRDGPPRGHAQLQLSGASRRGDLDLTITSPGPSLGRVAAFRSRASVVDDIVGVVSLGGPSFGPDPRHPRRRSPLPPSADVSRS